MRRRVLQNICDVLSGPFEDEVVAARVVIDEFCDVVHYAVLCDPAGRLGAVLRQSSKVVRELGGQVLCEGRELL